MPIFPKPSLRNKEQGHGLSNISKDNKSEPKTNSKASNKKPKVKQSLA